LRCANFPFFFAHVRMWHEWIPLFGVALLWGVTNPLLKRGSSGIASRDQGKPIQSPTSNPFVKVCRFLAGLAADFFFLLSRPLYLTSFAVNMCGSVLFYYTLSTSDLSIVVPLANSLTFIITTIVAYLLGEDVLNARTSSTKGS